MDYPTADVYGDAVITISVSDSQLTATTDVPVYITPVNDIPVISGFESSYSILEDTSLGPISLQLQM
jgi:hypothetical protein